MALLLLFVSVPLGAQVTERPCFSGIYPHLAYFNNENECGTGAVVPWAGRLWITTYGPHLPKGSSDKLYEITDKLEVTVRPESIGGTPANRMIHRESKQLFIGPYAIDEQRKVRAIPYAAMPGRHTANMRHLTDPANKIYYATMEEGFYEVNVKTLEVKELYRDGNIAGGDIAGKLLPGYHGKGAYTGHGRVIYANNGENSAEARRRADVPSGVLAAWDGSDWTVIRRNQFCDVTGPGGITGNENPEKDPIWTIGWDHRSVLLMVLEKEQGGKSVWKTFRLPKGSHSYDGAHGWNTEWPRIREIGAADDLLMTMHGTFWQFPKGFSSGKLAGIRPRSTYLKVIGDFAEWNGRIVFGCDDTAKSEFLNKRKAKGEIAGPGQSQSNLWFVEREKLEHFGPALGRGGVWVNDSVTKGEWSDPYLLAGYAHRGVHLSHDSPDVVSFEFEVDEKGTGQWRPIGSPVKVSSNDAVWMELRVEQGEWIRVRPDRDATRVTVFFHYANADARPTHADETFTGLARAVDDSSTGGLIRARGDNLRTLHLAAMKVKGMETEDVGYYELDGEMKLKKVADATAHEWVKKNVAIPMGVLSVDTASVVYVDDAGKRWRLPKGNSSLDQIVGKGVSRIDREIVTERDLFNSHGTFYELPAENAGGFAKIRPITTHNRRIHDYCSYRGLLVMTGVDLAAAGSNPHIIRSDDGKAAVWVGVADDLWKLGKAVGQGGPWKETMVKANEPSDPYLMTGYDLKRITLSHDVGEAVRMRVEVDVTGDGLWMPYRTFDVQPRQKAEHQFPAAFGAYWVRVVAAKDCAATAWLVYE